VSESKGFAGVAGSVDGCPRRFSGTASAFALPASTTVTCEVSRDCARTSVAACRNKQVGASCKKTDGGQGKCLAPFPTTTCGCN
jgi:hypothetical protein